MYNEDPRYEPISLWDDIKELKYPLTFLAGFAGIILSIALIVMDIIRLI
jgi:hypothetical protein